MARTPDQPDKSAKASDPKSLSPKQRRRVGIASLEQATSAVGCRLSGRVVSARTGLGLADLQVVALLEEGPRLGSSLTRDDGSFDLHLKGITGKTGIRISVFGPRRSVLGEDGAKTSDPPLLFYTEDPLVGLGSNEFLPIQIEGDVQRATSGMNSAVRPMVPFSDSGPRRASRSEAWREQAKVRVKRLSDLQPKVASLLQARRLPSELFVAKHDVKQKHAELVEKELADFKLHEKDVQGHWISVEDLIDLPSGEALDASSLAPLLPDSLPHSGQKARIWMEPTKKNTPEDQCKKRKKVKFMHLTAADADAEQPPADDSSPAPAADDADNPPPLDDSASTPPPSSEQIAADSLNAAIEQARRIALALSVGEDSEDLPSHANQESVNAALEASLKGGPADETAYYDFHSLRIAFRDMWTSVVDTKLAGDLAKLYNDIVTLENEYDILSDAGTTVDAASVEEFQEITELLARLEKSIALVETASLPPDEIRSWKPQVAEVWDYLPPISQLYVRTLYWLQNIALRRLEVAYWVRDDERLGDYYDPARQQLVFEGNPSAPPVDVPAYAQSFLDGLSKGMAKASDSIDASISSFTMQGRNARAAKQQVDGAISVGRLRDLLGSIAARKSSPHRFDIFTPGSYNFGIVLTYQQEWKPLNYQPGQLVATIPLAPGETRKYSKTRKVVSSRSQREVEKALSSRRFESSETGRAEAEIVRKAKNSSHFSLASQGTIEVPTPIGKVSSGSSREFGLDSGQESASTKSSFREAVRKAASEYKNEHSLEVSTEEQITSESAESGEISNPNNEIPVTYLFYELQRRFRIREQLHRVTPVVLVAMDVPEPAEINEAWLLEHDWILRRVILDDRLLRPLDMLSDSFSGDELGVEILRKQWEVLVELVSELKQDLQGHVSSRGSARSKLTRVARNASADDSGLIDILSQVLFRTDPDSAADQAKVDAAEQLLNWAESDLESSEGRLRTAVADLQSATKTYIGSLRDRLNRRTAIDQLILHVKQNILYYMQAVWTHEPPDQRFFRLYDLPIQAPEIGGECRVQHDSIRTTPSIDHLGRLSEKHFVRVKCPAPELGEARDLSSIADLSRLLGFKGNYAMFPLTVQNGITEFMMQDYLHDYYGVYDPDPSIPEVDIEDLGSLWNCVDASDVSVDRGNIADNIKKWLEEASKGGPTTEEITVPTGQLFIEALTGSHTVLEHFKLKHRQADVASAWADIRGKEIENIRKASRIAASDLSDPDIDKRIEIANPVNEVDVDSDA